MLETQTDCSKCKYCGEQTCVPNGLGCNYEPRPIYGCVNLSRGQINKINETVRNLQEENKKLKSIIRTLIKEFDLEPTEYVENLLRGDGNGQL